MRGTIRRGTALGDERGQILPLLAAGLFVVLLGFAAFVLDYGHAAAVKRQLQASSDAAALAAAQQLPNASLASSTAGQYDSATGKNALSVGGATVTAQTPKVVCLKNVTYCPPGGNGVQVVQTASVDTGFARVLGVKTMQVSATATACGPCASQPLDIAIVVDRTGSMSDDMGNLNAGVKTFLKLLNPTLDHVALLALPPGCSGERYPATGYGQYVIAGLSSDYLTSSGAINSSSRLVQGLNCLVAQGGTTYKEALEAAQDLLVSSDPNRRPTCGRNPSPTLLKTCVQKVIVFETDGAANQAAESDYAAPFVDRTVIYGMVANSDDINRPCGSAVDYAKSIEPAANADPRTGTVVMTIGYTVQSGDGCKRAPYLQCDHWDHWHSNCLATSTGNTYGTVSEGISATAALQTMASNPAYYIPQQSAGDMSNVFAQVAAKLNARLVPDDWASGG